MGKGRGSKKRGPGEGSIRKRPDGRYEGRYRAEIGGLAKQRSVYGLTHAEVRTKLAAALAERDAGIFHDAERLTVAQYLPRWLQSLEGEVRPSTYLRYEQNVRIHILPSLGRKKLAKLTVSDLESLYRVKLASGLARRTVTYIHTTMHQALKEAMRLEILPRNVASVAKPPRPKQAEIKPLTREQVGDLLKAAEGSRLEALFVLAASTGMRRSELLGLKWQDVDLAGATLQVRRGLTATSGFGVRVDDPKRFSSRRKIDLSGRVVESLAAHRVRQAEEKLASKFWRDEGFVFTSKQGSYVHPASFWDNYFKPVRKRAGLDDSVRFHDLRHTYATIALSGGIPVKVVSEVLGHKDISTTLSIYAHVIPGMGKEAAKLMDSLIF